MVKNSNLQTWKRNGNIVVHPIQCWTRIRKWYSRNKNSIVRQIWPKNYQRVSRNQYAFRGNLSASLTVASKFGHTQRSLESKTWTKMTINMAQLLKFKKRTLLMLVNAFPLKIQYRLACKRLKVLFYHFPSSLNWFLIDQMKIMPDPNWWFWLVDNQNFKLGRKLCPLCYWWLAKKYARITCIESHAKPNLNRVRYLKRWQWCWWHRYVDDFEMVTIFYVEDKISMLVV